MTDGWIGVSFMNFVRTVWPPLFWGDRLGNDVFQKRKQFASNYTHADAKNKWKEQTTGSVSAMSRPVSMLTYWYVTSRHLKND